VILPITLTGRLGLPGGGVPNFALDSAGNVIGAEFWPSGSDASGTDPATGEPMTAESSSSSPFTNDASVWTGETPGAPSILDIGSNVLNVGSRRNTRGTQWDRIGSQRSESQFDRWRRAGRPTACSMQGIGDYTLSNGLPCDPTVYGTVLCQDSTQRIINAIAAGAAVAAGTQIQPAYGTPGYVGTLPQVAVAGSASPGAWIVGIAAVAAVIYLVKNR
jgi:hypothetical protein